MWCHMFLMCTWTCIFYRCICMDGEEWKAIISNELFCLKMWVWCIALQNIHIHIHVQNMPRSFMVSVCCILIWTFWYVREHEYSIYVYVRIEKSGRTCKWTLIVYMHLYVWNWVVLLRERRWYTVVWCDVICPGNMQTWTLHICIYMYIWNRVEGDNKQWFILSQGVSM